ncbi:MAG TPA: N-acetylmuramoyl-L-alanine amidase [Candidatus Limnocylindria bacterium]|nr:N-acetylmuramoyl-L-alanine amidase [Candidatus Limnocylindria bacterium]
MHATGSAPEPPLVGTWHRSRALAAAATLAVALLVTSCGTDAPAPTTSAASAGAASQSFGTPAATVGDVEPAPGSDSAIYEPNPAAIVVAIDPGHGGCLDWGVPDPSERGVDWAEKTLTLGIAQHLRDLLEADGIGVVMIRDADVALAGDDYPPLGCAGPEWRDVNGDGLAGFGPDLPEATRTRDELQARLDLANLAQADALLSVHINAPSEGGQRIEIAFTQTFYTDETPWGPDLTQRLAADIQDGVVAGLGEVATYDRGDRGIDAHNFYIVAPPLFETSEERPDPVKQPTRGGLMPVVLSEVGSITLREEHDLLASAGGQAAIAGGLFDGLARFFAGRPTAARIGLADATVGAAPVVVPGDGPPYWAPPAPDEPLRLRIWNTGTEAWAAGAELIGAWEETDQPYLRVAPEGLAPLGVELPALEPGESTTVEVGMPDPPAGRAVAWISLEIDGESLSDLGSPALQVSSEAP